MSLLRIAVVAFASAALAITSVQAADPKPGARMPAMPKLGAASADAMPEIAGMSGVRQSLALAPARWAQTMKAALAADDVPLRGGLEQTLYKKFSRSVVLVVLPEGLGSGTVIDKDGTILTNWHVAGGYKSVGVIFKPTKAGVKPRMAEAVEAKVLYIDQIADLALIKVASLPADVTPLAIADHAKLSVGADVHAIGHPIGESWSYTKGIVSQIHPDYEWTTQTGAHRADVIQTQTPINPGNSGGPLLNNAGEVVGINAFGRERGSLLNFAVAATEIRRFVALKADRLPPVATADQTMPPTALPAAQSGSATCKVARLETRRSPREDATGHLLDTNCDGVTDAILWVPDSKTAPIELLIDANQNEVLDAVYVDEDRDLKFDYVLFDTDEDGSSDLLGAELDKDLKPRRIIAMKV